MNSITDAKSFWTAIGARAVGAAVVTATDETGPAGFLALSATHLTASPPTMLVSIGLKTGALQTILRAKHFAINYLSAGSDRLASDFGGMTERKGRDRFIQDEWSVLRTGAPILVGAVGAFDCELEEAIERHETVIAIGRIVSHVVAFDKRPMISFAGRYI